MPGQEMRTDAPEEMQVAGAAPLNEAQVAGVQAADTSTQVLDSNDLVNMFRANSVEPQSDEQPQVAEDEVQQDAEPTTPDVSQMSVDDLRRIVTEQRAVIEQNRKESVISKFEGHSDRVATAEDAVVTAVSGAARAVGRFAGRVARAGLRGALHVGVGAGEAVATAATGALVGVMAVEGGIAAGVRAAARGGAEVAQAGLRGLDAAGQLAGRAWNAYETGVWNTVEAAREGGEMLLDSARMIASEMADQARADMQQLRTDIRRDVEDTATLAGEVITLSVAGTAAVAGVAARAGEGLVRAASLPFEGAARADQFLANADATTHRVLASAERTAGNFLTNATDVIANGGRESTVESEEERSNRVHGYTDRLRQRGLGLVAGAIDAARNFGESLGRTANINEENARRHDARAQRENQRAQNYGGFANRIANAVGSNRIFGFMNQMTQAAEEINSRTQISSSREFTRDDIEAAQRRQ